MDTVSEGTVSQPRKTAAVHEQVGADGGALSSAHRCDRALFIEVRLRHVGGLMAHAALQRLLLQKLTQQHRVEVVSVPNVEGKMLIRLGR